MTTHHSVVGELARAASSGESVVLATVVRVIGSSYGGVGTRMVIRVDGSTVGLVSGGCLESDLCQHALQVHASGRTRVVNYDTRADDEAVWGLGLGCNGLIDVLLDPLSPERGRELATLLDRALSGDAVSVIATVIEAPDEQPSSVAVGAQALFAGDEEHTLGAWGDGQALSEARSCVIEALAAGRSGLVKHVEAVQIAFEAVVPAIRLVICGSGPDVVPLTRFAAQLGWDVTVVDHRPVTDAYVARFHGTRVVECAEAFRLEDALELSPRTAAVVMSHHFARDSDYVHALLSAGIAYIGVLGPRARTERMLAELATRGDTAAKPGDRLFAPVGLDLGGEGPEAIALAIIAEVSTVANGRAGSHLRDRQSLHSRPTEAGAQK